MAESAEINLAQSLWGGGVQGGGYLPPPPVRSLFELLSGRDRQMCKIKTRASSVVP